MPTMTAAQRRDQQRRELLAAMETCASRKVIGVLSDKWVTLVLRALADGPQRRGALSRTIAGASHKMLTQTLRGLERDGVLVRTITPDVPVRVEYELTPLGCDLLGLVRTITDWSETHIDELRGARAACAEYPAG